MKWLNIIGTIVAVLITVYILFYNVINDDSLYLNVILALIVPIYIYVIFNWHAFLLDFYRNSEDLSGIKKEWIELKTSIQTNSKNIERYFKYAENFKIGNDVLENVFKTSLEELEIYKATNGKANPFLITEIKYKSYLNNDNIKVSSSNQSISKVPKNLFENHIWKNLVSNSVNYCSIQMLYSHHKKEYLSNKNRFDNESNFICHSIKLETNSKLKYFSKLFIVDNEDIFFKQKNKKIYIYNYDLYLYLNNWISKLDGISNTNIKVLKHQDAIGSIELKDSGLFDHILGFQQLNFDRSHLDSEPIIFEFYFNQLTVQKHYEGFKNKFEDSICLNSNKLVYFDPSEPNINE